MALYNAHPLTATRQNDLKPKESKAIHKKSLDEKNGFDRISILSLKTKGLVL